MQILFSLIIYKKLINFNHNNIHQIFNEYNEKNSE